MVNIIMYVINLLSRGVCRLARTNTHFDEPYFIWDYAPECEILGNRNFVGCASKRYTVLYCLDLQEPTDMSTYSNM